MLLVEIEDALQGANLIHDLLVVVFGRALSDIGMDATDDSQKQVHEDDRVEYDGDDEENHLRVGKAFRIVVSAGL